MSSLTTTFHRLGAWLRHHSRRPVRTLPCPWCHAAIPLTPEITRQPCAFACLIGPYGAWLMQKAHGQTAREQEAQP